MASSASVSSGDIRPEPSPSNDQNIPKDPNTADEGDWVDDPDGETDNLNVGNLSIDEKTSGSTAVKSLAERISDVPSQESQAGSTKEFENGTAKGTGTKDEKSVPDGVKHGENLINNEYEVQVKLADMQADPNSPLYSAKSFEELGLKPELLQGIYAMKFQKPSKVQERALPLILSDPPQNMIAQSQAGTGKTAAFVLTMLSRIDYNLRQVQAICLAPTRELSRQIFDNVKAMGKFTPVKVQLCIPEVIERGARIDVQIVVGTPGTVETLLKQRAFSASAVRVFVLDEADNMLEGQNLTVQSTRVKSLCPKNVQSLLFSATFPDSVRTFAHRLIGEANEITLRPQDLSLETVRQMYLDCESEERKYDALVGLYGVLTIGSSIIFCARRDTADEIAKRMTAEGHVVTVLHGGQEGNMRDATFDDFREGRSKVLITTNVFARGIDVLTVNMVVNYDMPIDADRKPDFETYVHRVGRTGRFGRTGVAVNIIHDRNAWKLMDLYATTLGVEIMRIPTEDADEMEKCIKKALRGGV